MEKRLYFGHPVNVYGTALEHELVAWIGHCFPDWEIENPNQPRHDEGYKRYGRETGNGMAYFAKEVLPACHGGIFLPFRDGAWGAGVYNEASVLDSRPCPLWTIQPDGTIDTLSRAQLLVVHVLTVVETRERIRDGSGKIRPY